MRNFVKDISTFSTILLLPNLLLCQSDDYDYYFEHLNKSLFPVDNLVRLDIESVTCTSYTISIQDGHKNNSSETYSIIFNERSEPIIETRIVGKEKAEIIYEYMGPIQKITKRFGSYVTDSSDTFDLFNSITETYSGGLKKRSVMNFYKKWYVGEGNFTLIDTILYNSSGSPEKIIQLWVNKRNYLDIDTLFAFFRYDSLNRLIEYRLKPVDDFSSPVKFNYGCITPFLKHFVYRYTKEGAEKCEYSAKLASDSMELYGIIQCERNIVLSEELAVNEIEKNGKKYYTIKSNENGGVIEVNPAGIKKITYLKDSKLPKTLTLIDDDMITVYVFNYSFFNH